MSVITKTMIEIIVQNSDEDAETFKKALQAMINSVEKENPHANPLCMVSASSTGRMTVILHWKEVVKKIRKVRRVTLNPKKRK